MSYDSNLRLKLWPLPRARAVITATIAQCSWFLPSLDEAKLLSGEDDSGATAKTVKNKWIKNVGVTSMPPGLFSSSKVKGHDVGA